MVDADRQRMDGRRLDGYTISSSCELNGSGELIIRRMKRRAIHIILSCCKTHLIIYIMAGLENIPIIPAHSRTIVCLYKI